MGLGWRGVRDNFSYNNQCDTQVSRQKRSRAMFTLTLCFIICLYTLGKLEKAWMTHDRMMYTKACSLWRNLIMAYARLSKHGYSQEVRLPKEFRLPGSRVKITRE